MSVCVSLTISANGLNKLILLEKKEKDPTHTSCPCIWNHKIQTLHKIVLFSFHAKWCVHVEFSGDKTFNLKLNGTATPTNSTCYSYRSWLNKRKCVKQLRHTIKYGIKYDESVSAWSNAPGIHIIYHKLRCQFSSFSIKFFLLLFGFVISSKDLCFARTAVVYVGS